MKHTKTFIASSVIASSLLAGYAFAGQPKYITKRAQTAKPAEHTQRMEVASSLQAVAKQEQPRVKRIARGKPSPNKNSPTPD
jgi:hypothetical protein